MRNYELIFIVQPDLDEEGLGEVMERVQSIIGSFGGEITKIDEWGRRRLAYPVRRLREGYYVRMETRLPPDSIRGIERDFKLTEPLVRHLFVRMDEE